MRYPKEHWAISVTVTTECNRRCAHCTRGVRQVEHSHAPLPDIEAALRSLKTWPGSVACLGGEPTMHPQFSEVCELWRRYVPRDRAALFTGKPVTPEIQRVIDATFGTVSYNDHHGGSWHQPMFVLHEDVGLSYEEHVRHRERCWLHWHWCPEIKPGVGGYFCEVAATLDHFLTGGKNAIPVNAAGWWNWPIPEKQLALCEWCGVCLNLTPIRDTEKREIISRHWVEILKPAPGSYVEATPETVKPCDSVPQHYAKMDGVHYRRRVSLRAFLRQKRCGFGYHWRRVLLWPLQDIIRRKP